MSEWLTLIKGSDDDPAAEHQRRMLVKFGFPTFTILMFGIAFFLPIIPVSEFWLGAICLACLASMIGVAQLVVKLRLWSYILTNEYWLLNFTLVVTVLLYIWDLVSIVI